MSTPDLSEFSAFPKDKEPTKEFNYDFLGFGLYPSRCNVKMWHVGHDKWFVLFTDLKEGTSVTNASEQLVTEIFNNFLEGRDKENIFFAESYDTNTSNGDIDAIIPEWHENTCMSVTWEYVGKLLNK